mmetsp:Transcript_33336/g.65494  ORF Transcript_33336/g.65494 Transcript_33336/m.65494 type:complete len:133 (+) Transcript_33336:42-440(+)|eukprot:CAMPEP_0175105638 /NCGR_PEP_ID=MMETSP0086_2-20121207/10606_1 /TAXON_ID=136419 /ORGANISM="Unknown Unknown, Strain D1" /LENGTH=132 /DNA_ID=CAMNT_0016381587 /DNA_START=9 /DNA_END=407 /DNA_ORIENTATION=-
MTMNTQQAGAYTEAINKEIGARKNWNLQYLGTDKEENENNLYHRAGNPINPTRKVHRPSAHFLERKNIALYGGASLPKPSLLGEKPPASEFLLSSDQAQLETFNTTIKHPYPTNPTLKYDHYPLYERRENIQ